MSVFNLISLAGGVALFLYGMTIMGNGLEKLSGGRMEKTLEKLTGNIFTSVALGVVVTALVQSSSATTVIVVGLVNAGILQLRQAVGVIMGANIGTTVTAQIIRLSDIQSEGFFLQFCKPTTLAPLAAVIGIVLYMFSKRSKRREVGQLLVGFGILFSGLFAMEAAVQPLQTNPIFPVILAKLSNPLLGVLAGAAVTALIQSSSASIGILQAISSTGVLPFSTAFPIIMGQNIGTCITPILSSIGATKNAKRSAMIHLYFNIIGTLVFLTTFYTAKHFLGAPAFWGEAVTRTTIANFHTFFNVVTTLLLIPFNRLIVKLAIRTIRDERDDEESVISLLDERFFKSPSIALQQSEHVLGKLAEYASTNYSASVRLLEKYDSRLAENIREVENAIDKMEDKLEAYLLKLSALPIGDQDSKNVSTMLHLINEFERIGDYAINVVEMAEEMDSNNIRFSPVAANEISIITRAVEEIVQSSLKAYESKSAAVASKIEPLEETIDAIVETLKDMHVERLKNGQCVVHSGIVFLEILTNLERIADHCSSIGIYILNNTTASLNNYDRHEYLQKAHEATDADYVENFNHYMDKYFSKIGVPVASKEVTAEKGAPTQNPHQN
ncbi:MAG TPA: Na/Pi cotransporter family protein [Candidatus Fimivivens faecavium]|nr:Na/Pi cotransporter family protein [Candidatus Fimivivens faecavium]